MQSSWTRTVDETVFVREINKIFLVRYEIRFTSESVKYSFEKSKFGVDFCGIACSAK